MTTVSQAVLARNHPPRRPARGRAKADARVTADSVSHGVRADTVRPAEALPTPLFVFPEVAPGPRVGTADPSAGLRAQRPDRG